MAVKVMIPTPLRSYAGKRDHVEVAANTVGEALSSLVAQHGDLRRHLYQDDGRLRSFVNVYVNDDDIRYLQKEATPLRDGDTVSIVPSIAGGTDILVCLFGTGRGTERKTDRNVCPTTEL
jgi:molybdopterin converting factor small subunit